MILHESPAWWLTCVCNQSQDICCNARHDVPAVLLLMYVAMQGIVPVLLSWFVSPILAFIATSILFLGVRTLVLRRKNSFNLGCIALPFLVGLTFFVIVVFIIQTGRHKVPLTTAACGQLYW